MGKYAKLIAALAGAAAQAVNLGLVPDAASGWVTVGLGLLTALGVYAVPNQTAD